MNKIKYQRISQPSTRVNRVASISIIFGMTATFFGTLSCAAMSIHGNNAIVFLAPGLLLICCWITALIGIILGAVGVFGFHRNFSLFGIVLSLGAAAIATGIVSMLDESWGRLH